MPAVDLSATLYGTDDGHLVFTLTDASASVMRLTGCEIEFILKNGTTTVFKRSRSEGGLWGQGKTVVVDITSEDVDAQDGNSFNFELRLKSPNVGNVTIAIGAITKKSSLFETETDE